MGLLDDVLASLAGAGAPASRSQSSALVEAMLEVLGNGAQTGGIGGLDGLSRVLQQQGLGEEMSSWVGTGQNRPIPADRVSDVFGREQMGRISQRAGVGADLLPGILAAVLPALVDKLTPEGRVTPPSDLLALGRNLFDDAPSPGASRRGADFSDVRSGGSSTAPPPAAAKTYTVVAGDSLSKISKRVYGDGNLWRKIFDANRDQIRNPDLIHPGQVLKIP